jgi:hypothetical protein
VSQQFVGPGPWLILVRFEQGRGKGGVPKTWVPYLSVADKKPDIKTLTHIAIEQLRAWCLDPQLGHGQDLMPGSNDEYELHNVDGGRINNPDQILWETIMVGSPPQAQQRAEVVLTWRLPSELLIETVRK